MFAWLQGLFNLVFVLCTFPWRSFKSLCDWPHVAQNFVTVFTYNQCVKL